MSKSLNFNQPFDTSNPLRSRFGFHPCDYQLYLKLRFLHKHYWIALRRFHHWHRWILKDPQNRVGNEPTVAKAFMMNQPWFKPVKSGFKFYRKTVVDHDVIGNYHAARMPSDSPIEAFPKSTVAAIEQLYIRVQQELEASDQADT